MPAVVSAPVVSVVSEVSVVVSAVVVSVVLAVLSG